MTSIAAPPEAAPDAAARPAGGPRRSRRVIAGVAALLVVHFTLATAGSWNKTPMFDEAPHLGNGFSFWATNDYRMAPEAILVQRLMALPSYLAGAAHPATDEAEAADPTLDEAARNTKTMQVASWRASDNWGYCRALLYECGNDSWALIRSARVVTALFSVLLGGLTYYAAAQVFGTAGGLVALALYVFNPNTLAHGSAVTIDLAAALAMTAAMAALWRVIHRVTPGTVFVSCLVVAAAFATKASAVLLIPMGLLIALVRLLGRKPMLVGRGGSLREINGIVPQFAIILGLVVLHVVAAWIVIWALFGFRYEMFRDPVPGRNTIFTGDWDQVLEAMQTPRTGETAKRNQLPLKIVTFAREHQLLPEAYLYSYANGARHTSARSSFLNGRYGVFGFASFFPYCALYKTPLAAFFILLLAAAAWAAVRFDAARAGQSAWKSLWWGFYSSAPWWSLLVIYWGTAITSNINIGSRHILPTFPATFILAGAAGYWLRNLSMPWSKSPGVDAGNNAGDASRTAAEAAPSLRHVRGGLQATVLVGLVWLAGESLAAYPNYIAYFNPIVGGSANGYKHLVDSSLDWGQELANLKRWLDEHRDDLPPKVYISYFGSAPPKEYGVDGTWLPGYFAIESLEPGRRVPVESVLQPGVYCISATSLQCVYNVPYAGPWRDDYEMHYGTLFNLVKVYLQNPDNPAFRDEQLAKTGLPNWREAVKRFESARFGRLCAYLRQREPDDSVNHAILIYRLTKEDLLQALLGPPAEHFPPPEQPGDNVPY